ncbi:MAG TPA: HEPN domain-containing protein [Mariniphaga sp.]|nr:HEPN domain-containing protein [Mariniphaga sp.]
MNKATINFIRQWLVKANEDLLVVHKLTEYEIVATSSVCFHCQQAVEKFLKAFLIANGVDIKKTHSIEYLLSECSEFDNEFTNIDPKELSDFGVDVRYPGDMYVPNEDETLQYKNLAFEIKYFVESKIDKILNKYNI